MPTYDYQCAACGDQFEQFQSIKDDPLDTCPQCGKRGKVKRLIGTGAGIIFKGGGFYETDYKKKLAPASEGKSPDGKKSEASGSKAPAPAKSDA